MGNEGSNGSDTAAPEVYYLININGEFGVPEDDILVARIYVGDNTIYNQTVNGELVTLGIKQYQDFSVQSEIVEGNLTISGPIMTADDKCSYIETNETSTNQIYLIASYDQELLQQISEGAEFDHDCTLQEEDSDEETG